MSGDYRFIEQLDGGWRDSGADLPCADKEDHQGDESHLLTVDEIAEQLARAKPDSCVILLRSSEVFFSRFAADEVEGTRNLQTAANHQTLAFRFEEDLPFDAEQLACDFRLAGESGDQFVTAMGTRIHTLEPLIQTLQSRGIPVRGVCPWIVLTAQAIVRSESLNPEGCLVFRRPTGWSFIAWREHQLVGWRTGIADRAGRSELKLFLHEHGIEGDAYLVSVDETGDSAESTSGSDSIADFEFLPQRISPTGHSASVAALLDSKEELWCDFRRDPRLNRSTAQQRLRRSLVVATLCSMLVAMALFARSWSLEQQRLAVSDKQSDVFKAAFPNARVPSAVLRRLNSELTKLRGVSDPARDVPQKGRAFPTMGTLMKSLPGDVNFTVEEARVDDRNATLTMLLADYEEAASVVERLSQAGFEVGPPATESVGEALRAVISATESSDE